MKEINSKKQFLQLIEDNNEHVVFCYHNWSGYSIVAKKSVEEWVLSFGQDVNLIDASENQNKNYFLEWLIENEKGDWFKEGITKINRNSPQNRVHGYGEICWIKNRKVVGFESVHGFFNPESLENRTRELFD